MIHNCQIKMGLSINLCSDKCKQYLENSLFDYSNWTNITTSLATHNKNIEMKEKWTSINSHLCLMIDLSRKLNTLTCFEIKGLQFLVVAKKASSTTQATCHVNRDAWRSKAWGSSSLMGMKQIGTSGVWKHLLSPKPENSEWFTWRTTSYNPCSDNEYKSNSWTREWRHTIRSCPSWAVPESPSDTSIKQKRSIWSMTMHTCCGRTLKQGMPPPQPGPLPSFLLAQKCF